MSFHKSRSLISFSPPCSIAGLDHHHECGSLIIPPVSTYRYPVSWKHPELTLPGKEDQEIILKMERFGTREIHAVSAVDFFMDAQSDKIPAAFIEIFIIQ